MASQENLVLEALQVRGVLKDLKEILELLDTRALGVEKAQRDSQDHWVMQVK